MIQKTFPINLRDRTFNAVVVTVSGKDMVVGKPVCDAIGVDDRAQQRKLENNPQFSCGLITATGTDGKSYEMWAIPLEEVAMWLCGINANRVKPEIKDALISFQKFCQMELYLAVTGQAGSHKVDRLEKTVEMLAREVSRLSIIVESRDVLDSSYAGKLLAARKAAISAH